MIAIKINKITKFYSSKNQLGAKEMFLKNGFFSKKKSSTYAIKNLSFTIKYGESVAILGHNGSGKSTTLSLISGVSSPSSGEVILNSPVSSMLELTSGINTELSGLQNIFLYSSLLGTPLNVIKKNLPNIIDFSELNDVINNQVRTYSSGMIARLAFSIITANVNDILVIDEVFAVGDYKFKRKCFDFLRKFKKNGGTLLMVTHDAETAKIFCERGIVLSKGKKIYDGDLKNAYKFYLN